MLFVITFRRYAMLRGSDSHFYGNLHSYVFSIFLMRTYFERNRLRHQSAKVHRSENRRRFQEFIRSQARHFWKSNFQKITDFRPKLNPAAPDFRELQRWQNYETLEPGTGLARAEQGPTFGPGRSRLEPNLEINTSNGDFSVDLQVWEISELVQASGLRIPMGVWGSREISDYHLADQVN